MANDEFPFTWIDIDPKEKAKKLALFGEDAAHPHVDMVRSVPGSVHMPRDYVAEDFQGKVRNFETRPDDVWVVTYPKCGTTWMQEILWLMVNDVDTERANQMEARQKVPFIEYPSLKTAQHRNYLMEQSIWCGDPIKWAAELPKDRRRIIKSHMPIEFLPPDILEKNKVIYVARNPKDCAVSYYKFTQITFPEITATFDEFLDLFKAGTTLYGSYWYHLKSGWEKRNNENVKFVWYEDMQKDIGKVVDEVSDFIGVKLTEDKREKLISGTSFASMKSAAKEGAKTQGRKEYLNKFYRKGIVGDWRDHFDEVTMKEWDEWIAENIKGTGIEFNFGQ